MAAAAAADKVLISTHLSDVYSSLQTDSISISTSKPHVPFPPQASDDEPPPEHAQYASFFHSVQTGLILLRLIHNGLILELVSLSTETPPIRFVFPYTVLPNPALVLWETRELHILVVTASGSLYRLVLPLQTPQQLWSTHMVNNWCREYHLKYVQEYLQGQVQVQGTHTVAVGLTDGSLIRLDAETIGDKTTAGPSMFPSFPFSYSHSHAKTTGPRACFITIHFLRRSRPSFTKALLMAHISSH
jgi:nuclear pore complex protein Nup160